ncbi:MAG: cytochrome c peroxidase [Planctomycetota bacterium]
MTTRSLALAAVTAVILAGCSGDKADSPSPTGTGSSGTTGNAAGSADAAKSQAPTASEPSVQLDLSAIKTTFANEPPSVPDKPGRLSRSKVALGRKLYNETRLSRGGDVSCATCHDVNNFGQDGKKLPTGTNGVAGTRNTPSSFNAHRQYAQFWDYRATTIEAQSTVGMLAEDQHGLKDEAEIEGILRGIPDYEKPFADAFPRDEQPITAKNVQLAIGAFQRKLETRSRFDEFLDGKEDALTAIEKKGLKAFMNATCTTCHAYRTLGGYQAQKLGNIRPFETEDKGRMVVTGKKGDEYMFKVPNLLNVAKTGPYLHDGSIESLEETVRFMAKHQVAIPVSEDQIKSIVAFLGSLTGELVDPSVIQESE